MAAFSGSDDNDSRKLFAGDDEETLSLLFSGSDTDIETLPLRLEGLSQRFLEDQDPACTAHWLGLVDSTRGLGFLLSDSQALPSSTVSVNNESSASPLPEAFDSNDGKLHILATASILGLSKTSALQLTLSALRSVKTQKDKPHFESSLGTRALLEKVMDHYYRQRVARLSIIAECLRMEQDDSCEDLVAHAVVAVLDSLDAKSVDNGKRRGLFRFLLSTASQPDTALNRDRLLPAKKLRTTSSTSTTATTTSSTDHAWKQFIVDAMEMKRAFFQRERLEALEALLALLYDRIQGGVGRADFCLVLVAFQSSRTFFTDYPVGNERLPRLAGLICAECLTFSSILKAGSANDNNNDNNSDDTTEWVSSHPMLRGLFDESSDQAKNELHRLTSLLLKFSDQVVDRKMRRWSAMSNKMDAGQPIQVETPESLAILSFGLLLLLAYSSALVSSKGASMDAYWQTFSGTGMELAKKASEDCDAFDYMYLVMDYLVHAAQRVPETSANSFYDATVDSNDEMSDSELSAPSITYASIGCELLTAAVSAFQDTILSVHHVAAPENVGMLCNLTSVIFRNSPLLCESFWVDWQSYVSVSLQSSATRPSPLCLLMDSALQLATSALGSGKSSEDSLRGIAPVLRLAASLACDADLVEAILISLFPIDLIKKAISLCSAAVPQGQSNTVVHCRDIILDSICTLANVGNSSSCRKVMRSSLGDGELLRTLGPRMLLRFAATAGDDGATAQKVFMILSDLLLGAPEEWVLEVTLALKSMQDLEDTWRGLFTRAHASTKAAVKLVDGLVNHMSRVLFSSTVQEEAAIGFLSVLAHDVLSLGTLLASSLSTTSRQLHGGDSVSYGSAQIILDCITNTLNQIRPVLELHESHRVRAVADELRNSLINTLVMSKGLGEAVFFYAVAPVSLSTMKSLDDWMQDANVLKLMSTDASNAVNTPGNFTSLRGQSASLPEHKSAEAKKYLVGNLLASIKSLSLDLGAVQAKGWISGDEARAPLRASASALRLLTSWAEHAEDMIEVGSRQLDDGIASEISAISPYRLLSSLAFLPPAIRADSDLSSSWMAAGVTNFSLILRYLSENDGNIPSSLSSGAWDFMFACLQHAKKAYEIDGTREDILFSAVYHSAPFHQILKSTVHGLTQANGREDVSEKELVLTLRGLRVLGACVDMGPSIAVKLLAVFEPSMVGTLSECVSSVIDSLQRSRPSMPKKLRIAEVCLRILRSIWRYARMSSRGGSSGTTVDNLKSIVEKETQLLSQIASFVFSYPNNVDAADKKDTAALRSRGILLSFTSIALDLLTIETEWARNNDRISSELNVVKALESALGQDLSRLVATSKQFMATHGFLGYAEAHESFVVYLQEIKRAKLPSSGVPNKLFTTSSPEPFRTIAGHVFFLPAAHWFGFFQSDADITAGRDASYTKLAVSYEVLSKELQCLSAWRYFSELFSLLLKKWRRQSSGAAILSMPAGTFSTSMTSETLHVLNENLSRIELAQLEASPELLVNEILALASESSGLLLNFARVEDLTYSLSTEDWIASLVLISQSSKKLLELLRGYSMVRVAAHRITRYEFTLTNRVHVFLIFQACSFVLQQLFASAIAISAARKDTASLSYDMKSRSNGVRVELAATACKVLRAIEGWAASSAKSNDKRGAGEEERRKYRSCFCTCVSLLSSLSTKDESDSSLEGRRYYTLKLHSVFKEFDVVRSLVLHAGFASTPDVWSANESGANAESNTRTKLDEEELALVLSVFNFFTAIAVGGDPSMLSLLVEGNASLLLSRNAILSFWGQTHSSVTAFPLRGYVPEGAHDHRQSASGNTGARYAGLDDPAHLVWKAGLKFIASTLRSSSRNTDVRDGTMSRYCSMAFDFLMSNREPVLASLRQCSSVTFGSKSFVLTLNSLREATLIMSIISELSSRTVVDTFKCACPDLYNALIGEAKSLVASISSFLGASGASRELFRAMADFETADGTVADQGYHFGALSPVYQVLSSGVPNAKHEAIRYSHFVSRCSAAVTREDHESKLTFPPRWKRNSRGGSTTDPHSVSSLEHNCRNSVTSDFSLELEQSAAECLFFAVSIVWKTHPASNSFVMFSEEEAAQLDAMPFVRPGMVIAFRARNRSEGIWVGEGNSLSSVYFGTVLHCDTVHRVWNVRLMSTPSEAGADTCFVSDGQLAGIEDTTKRCCILAFSPAPETSSELESVGRSISVGHLILALRWCHQAHSELRGENPRGGVGTVVSRLAELVTAFVGTELSIHQEIGSQHSTSKPDADKILAAQLLDLFGETSEFGVGVAESFSDPTARRYGRLKEVVCGSVWEAIRRQLRNELERATNDIQAKRSGKSNGSMEVGWHTTGIRRSGNQSPFRGIGM